MKGSRDNLCPRHGFIVLDTLLSTLLILMLLMLVTVSVIKQTRATRELAANRAAVRTCEETLTRMQARVHGTADGVQTAVLPDTAPDGLRWVQVTATCEGHRATLTGLVPGGAP